MPINHALRLPSRPPHTISPRQTTSRHVQQNVDAQSDMTAAIEHHITPCWSSRLPFFSPVLNIEPSARVMRGAWCGALMLLRRTASRYTPPPAAGAMMRKDACAAYIFHRYAPNPARCRTHARIKSAVRLMRDGAPSQRRSARQRKAEVPSAKERKEAASPRDKRVNVRNHLHHFAAQ